MIFRDVIPKIIPKRRVLIEKIKPSFRNVEYMFEDLLSDCEIYLSVASDHNYTSRDVFFYVKNNIVILELQKQKQKDVVIINSKVLHYDVKSEPYKYKTYIRRQLQIFFGLSDECRERISLTYPSDYNHVLQHGRLLNLE